MVYRQENNRILSHKSSYYVGWIWTIANTLLEIFALYTAGKDRARDTLTARFEKQQQARRSRHSSDI